MSADRIKAAGRIACVAMVLLAAACRLPASSEAPVARTGPRDTPSPVLAAPPPTNPAPVVVTLAPDIPSAAATLDDRIAALGRAFSGDVGLAVRDIQTGWTSHHRGLDHFPQQSVSKLWVAIATLDGADRGALALDAPLTVGRDDLTLFHQPVRTLALRPGGYRTTAADLLERALTESDNTANDVLLARAGGPEAVRAMLDRKALTGIRFGPGERSLQSQIAGMDWQPDFAFGRQFHTARDSVPAPVRQAAFDAYTADPMDGATPLAMVDALARLQKGQLLSPSSTRTMLSVMARTRTGPNRLKGGLPPGWTLSHKTGTGQVLNGEQAGYNDVGILTSPEGRAYAVAVLIGRTGRPLRERMTLMHRLVAATVAYDAALDTQRAGDMAD